MQLNSEIDVPETLSVEAAGQLSASQVTAITEGGGAIHAFPSLNHLKTSSFAAAADFGPLIYHTGGAVMGPTVTIYPIFWIPAKLQYGHSTGMSTHYQAVVRRPATASRTHRSALKY